MKIEATFEETVVHYPFAPLVLMAIAVARWVQHSRSVAGARSDSAMHTMAGATQ